MSHASLPSNFLKNVLQNGVGRHVCQLQRITISFCKSHVGSVGVRDFIENYMLDFTKSNPGIVVYLKPRRHRRPVLKAEFLNGYSEDVSLTGCDKDAVAQWVGLMRGRSGVQIQRLRKDWHTDNPSIQGVWHPFMFKDTRVSVANLQDPELSRYMSPYKTATEKLIEMQALSTHQGGVNSERDGATLDVSDEKGTDGENR